MYKKINLIKLLATGYTGYKQVARSVPQKPKVLHTVIIGFIVIRIYNRKVISITKTYN